MKYWAIVKQHSVYCDKEKDTKNFEGETLGYVTPVSIVKLQWLEHIWDYENLFETGVVRAIEGLL